MVESRTRDTAAFYARTLLLDPLVIVAEIHHSGGSMIQKQLGAPLWIMHMEIDISRQDVFAGGIKYGARRCL